MLGFFKKKVEILKAPMAGEVVDITKVADPVFAEKALGDGVAIKPSDGLVVAPCDGKITQIFPTNHAIGIETTNGLEILIHIGLDTVNLKGEGFTRLIEEGTSIKTGTPIMKVDLELLKKNEKDTVTPVVITNMDRVKSLDKMFKGDEMMHVTIK
ncbi:PTS glucose transporter subunit IIA [Clostridiaceae bacterium M8S5]|nr:PTS glucose transporter subunit IIA [Clostridiaceae bacterium M8S5]